MANAETGANAQHGVDGSEMAAPAGAAISFFAASNGGVSL